MFGCKLDSVLLQVNENFKQDDGADSINASTYRSLIKFTVQVYAKSMSDSFWSSQESLKISARNY